MENSGARPWRIAPWRQHNMRHKRVATKRDDVGGVAAKTGDIDDVVNRRERGGVNGDSIRRREPRERRRTR